MSSRFADFRFDPENGVLFRGDREVSLTPKTRELLRLFLENPGRTLTREEITNRVWPDVIVTDNALSFQVTELRKLLGEAGALLRTIPKVGYRWEGSAVDTSPEKLPLVFPSPEGLTDSGLVPGPPTVKRGFPFLRAGALLISLAVILWAGSRLHRRFVGEPPSFATPAPVRIAVLPLMILGSGDPDTGIGLADSLGIRLSLLPGVTVRSTSFVLEKMKGHPAFADMARVFDVDSVIDGSIRAFPELFEVRLRLIEAGTGRTIWTGDARAAAGDRIAIEERLSHDLAHALGVPLESLAIERWSAPATADVAELYWRAQALSLRGWRASREAQKLLAEAIAADPHFGAAHSLRAQLLGLEVGYGFATDPERNHRESLAEAREAVKLEPQNPFARSVLGGAMADAGELDAGAAEACRARDDAPSRPSIHMLLGWLYRWAGLLERAESAYSIAFRLDGSLWRAGVHLSYVQTLLGQDDAARSTLDRLRTFGATAETAAIEMGAWRDYGHRKFDEAEAACRSIQGREPVLNYCDRLRALVAARRGDSSAARAFLARPGENLYPDGRRRFDRAAVFAVIGDPAGALSELAAAEKYGFQTPQALRFDPDLTPHLEDLGFREIATRWDERRRAREKSWR